MLSPLVLSLLLVGVFAKTCTEKRVAFGNEIIDCGCCSYSSAPFPGPEQLWATSRSVVLRARRPCPRVCNATLRWMFQSLNTTTNAWNKGEPVPTCDDKEYCELKNKTSSRDMLVRTAVVSGEEQFFGNFTHVKFCPEWPPPQPSDVVCELERGAERSPRVRWRQRPEVACRSYAHFLVRTRREQGRWRPWRWLGETSPGGEHGGGVRRCREDPALLCADLSLADAYSVIQIGVRHIDANNAKGSIAEGKAVICYSSIAGTQPTPASNASSHTCPDAPHGSDHWRWMALVAGCIAVGAIAMLPLVFCAGRRWRGDGDAGGGGGGGGGGRAGGGSDANTVFAWKRLNESRRPLPPTPDSRPELPDHDDFPPAYAYDYVTQPLPRPPTAAYERNDLYSPSESSEPLPLTPSDGGDHGRPTTSSRPEER